MALVHRMVQDSDDPHRLALDIVEDAVPSMAKGADRRMKIGTERATLRIVPKPVECMFEAAEVVHRNRLAEALDTVLQYLREIGRGRASQAEISHAAGR